MKQKILLTISAVIGILAAFLTRTYLEHKNAEVERLKANFYEKYGGQIKVLAFARNLPAGATVQKSDLGLLTVPQNGLRGQAITEEYINDVIGRRLLGGRREKDILFWSDLEGGNPAISGLASNVKKQMRAISVNCSGAAAVSGMVRPNDHVDVLGTFSFPGKTVDEKGRQRLELVTCTIMQNVLVLATGKETAKSAAHGMSSGAGYSTVTLEVTPREAEMLVFAEQIKGRIVLSLRNRNDTSYEKELPQVDFAKIQEEIEELNTKRQLRVNGK